MSEKLLNLDREHLKQIVLKYPEEVRQGVLWLGDFTRDRCGGRVSVLQETVRQFKLGQTDNYFYKVLSGRYFIDKQGNRIGSIYNFLEVVNKLQAAFKLSTESGAVDFIETSVYRSIADYIAVKASPHTICKFGVIIGYTGSQKTASYKRIRLLRNPADEKLRRICILVEASDSVRLGQFRTDIVAALGGSRLLNQKGCQNYIMERVQSDTILIIDNAQRLYFEGSSRQPIFEYLIKLQEDTGCTPILSLTPDSQLRRDMQNNDFFEQIIGRAGGVKKFLILPDYPPHEDLIAIARAFGLENPEQHLGYLERLSRLKGRIRILFDTFQEAKQNAMADGKPLTIDYLQEVRSAE